MADVCGTELTPEERDRLRHPLIGGVTLFARNYVSRHQLKALTRELHTLRNPALLVAVDQEGGRVQRFTEGFTVLPAPGVIGDYYDRDPHRAVEIAQAAGYVMAAELHAAGVDLSFAPVLDVVMVESTVIGDRGFHRTAEGVTALASAFVRGMSDAGMPATGKHFPGHGGVTADSHVCLPTDHRSYELVSSCDLMPYRQLIGHGLAGVMTAHVHYVQLDKETPTFSRYWLQEVLRGTLGFDGVIFSDDLSMEGATVRQDVVERAGAALAAGCDMALICNNPGAVDQVLAGLPAVADRNSQRRVQRLTRGLVRSHPTESVGVDAARQLLSESAKA